MSRLRFVVDNSVVVAWGLDEGSEYADAVIEKLMDADALVPGIWPLQFTNVLLAAERRKRISESDGARLLELVVALPILVVPDPVDRVITETLKLARQQGLSVYDASYLDLARRERVPLATLDRQLRSAARQCGVELL